MIQGVRSNRTEGIWQLSSIGQDVSFSMRQDGFNSHELLVSMAEWSRRRTVTAHIWVQFPVDTFCDCSVTVTHQLAMLETRVRLSPIAHAPLAQLAEAFPLGGKG